jgi:hypothetical protein
VDELDNVWTDWCFEDGWEGGGGCLFSSEGEDGEYWAGSHGWGVFLNLRSSDAGRLVVLVVLCNN